MFYSEKQFVTLREVLHMKYNVFFYVFNFFPIAISYPFIQFQLVEAGWRLSELSWDKKQGTRETDSNSPIRITN